MWNCNWGYPSFMHGSGFMGHGPIGLLAIIVILAVVVSLVVFLIKSFGNRCKTSKDTVDSLEIIKTKFARGEITEEEYLRMKDILIN